MSPTSIRIIALLGAAALCSAIVLGASYASGIATHWFASLTPLELGMFRSGCLVFTTACLVVVGMRLNQRRQDRAR